MSITRQEFNSQAIAFIKRCREVADDWSLIDVSDGKLFQLAADELQPDRGPQGQLMLTKNRLSRYKLDQIRNYEYSVVYSESYEVPVMYFSVNDRGRYLSPRHEA